MSSGARSDGRSAVLPDPVDAGGGYPRIASRHTDWWKTPLTQALPDLYRPASALGLTQG